MATEKETVILDFQVNQGDAISDLEKTKTTILNLKKEQLELNKAYKAGTITQEEYVSELVRVEGILKKQTSTYNNVQKSVTGVKTQLDKLIDSNKKISASFQEAANNINIAGVNVGQLGTKINTLTGPAGIITGAVAVVGALGAAYARSTAGAKDLEFAQNQLGIATTLITNNFANLITSAEDGEGALTRLLNGFLRSFGPSGIALSESTKALALAQEVLDDLVREEITARSNVSDRLADNQELLTKIQDSQTSYNEKIHLAGEIIANIYKNEDELLKIKSEQLKVAEGALAADQNNEAKQTAVLNIQREISNIQKDAERRRQGILRLESNITDQYNKQNEALKKTRDDQEEERRKSARASVEKNGAGESNLKSDPVYADALALSKAQIKLAKKTDEEILESAIFAAKVKQEIRDQELFVAQSFADSTTEIARNAFGEQSAIFKISATAQTLISTFSSATKSYDALAGIPYVGPALGFAAAAAAVAAGLANVAQINDIDIAAAGGADFVTKGPTTLLVGDNPGGRERVSVTPLSGKGQTRVFNGGLAMAGGGTLEVDGGAARNSATSDVNQSIMMANALKNLPPAEVSVKEITKVQKRIVTKERISKVGGRRV